MHKLCTMLSTVLYAYVGQPSVDTFEENSPTSPVTMVNQQNQGVLIIGVNCCS